MTAEVVTVPLYTLTVYVLIRVITRAYGAPMARNTREIRFPDLAAYIEATGVKQRTIAAEVGTTQATISRIIRGDMVPRPRLASRLAAFASIPIGSFVKVHLARKAKAS